MVLDGGGRLAGLGLGRGRDARLAAREAEDSSEESARTLGTCVRQRGRRMPLVDQVVAQLVANTALRCSNAFANDRTLVSNCFIH